MAYDLVASGGVVDLPFIGQYEEAFPEGSKGLLRLYLRSPVPQDVLDALNNEFSEQGVNAYAEAGSPIVNIYFQKGFPWLGVIAAIVVGLIALAILIVIWQLFKESPVAASLLALASIAAATVLTIALVRKQRGGAT